MKNQNPSQTIVNETHLAMRVSVISVIVNLVLSAFKLLAGIFANSGAMISDAVHSASDVFSTFIVMIGVTISGKKADKEHPYGHERMECVAAIVLAVILFATGLGIGWSGIQKIFFMNSDSLEVPGMLALIAALVSIVTKEWMYWFTKFTADKIRSDALRADAWHHRSDAFSSIGALVGIVGARMGFPVMDPIASLVIFVFIVKAAYEIFKDAMDKMVDHSCDEKTEEQLRACVLQNPDVARIDLLQTRIFGNKIYADIEIEVDGSMPLREAHKIAEVVHNSIEKTFPKVKHIMVHVNPEIDRK